MVKRFAEVQAQLRRLHKGAYALIQALEIQKEGQR